MNTNRYIFFTVLCLSTAKIGEAIRCFECSSADTPSCGDPIQTNRLSVVDCDNFSQEPTFMCYKVSQYVLGNYLTVRGCLPFTQHLFPRELQQGINGVYWKGLNSLSMCDHDSCNGAFLPSPTILTTGLASLLLLCFLS